MKYRNSILRFSLITLFLGCAEVMQTSIPITDKPKSLNEEIVIKIDSTKLYPGKKSIVLTGIDVLEKNNFDILKGKRIGLITNQTGVNNKLVSTIDILYKSPAVNLVALFGPEHGVRGDVEAGGYIKSYTDESTKLPVYSLYGKTRKPTSEMLKNVDALVYDIQDIGVRSYTFISTMGLAMEAASENGIEFIVLDRPNPLGGLKVEGNIVEKPFISFIGQFPIPYVYGLTCGELAKLLIGQKFINTKPDFKFDLVTMEGWERKMDWEDTGLNWVPTSPHIPHSFSAYYYPMTGILGELRDVISIGVGYTLPFQIVGTTWINSQVFSEKLNSLKIPGLLFRPISYQPYYAFGKNTLLNGVQIFITDYKSVNLIKTQFYIIFALKELYPDKNLFDLATKAELGMFNKAVGTDKAVKLYQDGMILKDVINYLDKDVKNFRNTSQKYLLYE